MKDLLLTLYSMQLSLGLLFLTFSWRQYRLALLVGSVSLVGVTELVRHSSKLLTHLIGTEQFITDDHKTIENLKR